jgi:FAD-dependent urate hydroxylase
MTRIPVAIVGAGPYGLSVAAHLAARKIDCRIFGQPMLFWSNIAAAGNRRFLKSYCFGTNLSTPGPGFTFADFNGPRGLETFEPCSIGNFAEYGRWFQENIVPTVEAVDVTSIRHQSDRFALTLDNDERLVASSVVLATGLSGYAYVPPALQALPPRRCTHTANVTSFDAFRGQDVAVIGGGQSALEAAALLHEAGARPQLLVRDRALLWHHRVLQQRSVWRRIRSPITGLGTGPKAWALTKIPGGMHRLPASWRTRFVRSHLPAEGAWWLRERVEGVIPIHCNTVVLDGRESGGRLHLRLRDAGAGREVALEVDHVIAGSGYSIEVERMTMLDPALRSLIGRLEAAPRLNRAFGTSVPGLHVVGPASAMSFGPLFRFVVGAEYTAQTVAAHLAKNGASAA